MKDETAFVIVPLAGYAGLWVLGSVLFLVYFQAFNVPTSAAYSAMIQDIPAPLAIATVPLCSLASFFTVTTAVLSRLAAPLGARKVLALGAESLLFTIAMDLLVTVLAEGVDILVYPTDVMYILAYAVIVPSVVYAGRRQWAR